MLQILIVLPIILSKSFLDYLIAKKLTWLIFYFFIYVIISQNLTSVKIFISIIFFTVFAFIGSSIDYIELRPKARFIWFFGVICFAISLVVSIRNGIYFEREFFNFEHVNLLGSYMLFLSMFAFIGLENISITKLKLNSILGSKMTPVFTSFLTLSTGTFLTQLTSFIPTKYYRLKNIVYLAVILIFGTFLIYLLTRSLSPDLHIKIFGTLNYFIEETTFSEFYKNSINRNLDLYNSVNSGSFTWRIYSYIFYIHQIFNRDVASFFFGSGLESYRLYANFAPHNDFIAIILDFGILGVTLFLTFLSKIFKYSIRKNLPFLTIFIVFGIMRFAFENLIYSSYLFSFICSIGGIIIGSTQFKKA